MPRYYDAYKKEHYCSVEERFGKDSDDYKNGYRITEEIPYIAGLREKPLPIISKGFRYILTVSVCGNAKYNTDESVEFFKK